MKFRYLSFYLTVPMRMLDRLKLVTVNDNGLIKIKRVMLPIGITLENNNRK